MLIAKVIGTTVSTIKDEMLTGRKLLILRQTDETGDSAPGGNTQCRRGNSLLHGIGEGT